MNLKKTLKSVALAGMTFAAGFGAYHATHSKSEKRYPTSVKAETQERTTVQYQKMTHDSYELRAGVLMPFVGETVADYEARRTRLEKQENRLRVRMLKHYQERLATLTAQKANPKMIAAVADRVEEYKNVAHYLSCYTPEGQKRLQDYNTNQMRMQHLLRAKETPDF